jgi:hypothetical protein
MTAMWTPAGMAMGRRNPATWLVPQSENPDLATKDRLYLVTGDRAKEQMDRYQGKTVTLLGPLCSSPSPECRKCIAPVEIR